MSNPAGPKTSKRVSRDPCTAQNWHCGDRAAGQTRNRPEAELAADPRCSGLEGAGQNRPGLAESTGSPVTEGYSPDPGSCCGSHARQNAECEPNFFLKHTRK